MPKLLIPTIQLLRFLLLADFPSGSSINYYQENFYLVGDDASHILILNKEYEKVDSIKLFDYVEKRIPKSEKVDFEASTLMQLNGEDHLLIFGSASREVRKRVMIVPLTRAVKSEQAFQVYDISTFISQVVLGGIKEVNIEGVTLIGDHVVLANRGNVSNSTNHLLVAGRHFRENQQDAILHIAQLITPALEGFIGVSEIVYWESEDVLFVTMSSEATTNSYEDGAIGHSYIGWVKDIRQKIKNTEVPLDGLINLSDVSPEFIGEKIEGICVESVSSGEYILHLVSDNDQGQSRLFKINMNFR